MQLHWGMWPSVKHVLGVQEWSYVVPEKKPFWNWNLVHGNHNLHNYEYYFKPFQGPKFVKYFWKLRKSVFVYPLHLSRTPPPPPTWNFCFAFRLNLSKGSVMRLRFLNFLRCIQPFPKIKREKRWDCVTLLVWYGWKVLSILSQIFLTGSQKKTYQEMFGLAHMQKEKENQEHCSSLSARSALSVNTSLVNLYKFQTWYLSILLHMRVSDEKKISCKNALISASLAIKETNLNIKHKSSLKICTFFT